MNRLDAAHRAYWRAKVRYERERGREAVQELTLSVAENIAELGTARGPLEALGAIRGLGRRCVGLGMMIAADTALAAGEWFFTSPADEPDPP